MRRGLSQLLVPLEWFPVPGFSDENLISSPHYFPVAAQEGSQSCLADPPLRDFNDVLYLVGPTGF